MFAHICTLSRTDSSLFLRGTSEKTWPFSCSGSSQARGRSWCQFFREFSHCVSTLLIADHFFYIHEEGGREQLDDLLSCRKIFEELTEFCQKRCDHRHIFPFFLAGWLLEKGIWYQTVCNIEVAYARASYRMLSCAQKAVAQAGLCLVVSCSVC